MNRRTLLRSLSATGIATGVAGCSRLFGPSTATPEWTVDIENASSVSPPAVLGDSVVVGAQDKAVHVLAVADGNTRLRAETGGPIEARPVVPRGTDRQHHTIHAHSTDGDLYGVELGDGITWRVEGDAVTAALARAGSVVVHAPEPGRDEQREATAYDATDGTELWQHPADTYQLEGVTPKRTMLPVAAKDTESHRVVALDNETGAVAWQTGPESSFLVAADSDLAVAARGGESWTEVAGYAPVDGSRRWRTRLDSNFAFNSDPQLGSHVFLTMEADEKNDIAEIISLNRSTGNVDGRHQFEGSIRATTAADDTVYVGFHVSGDEGAILKVLAVASDGTHQWTTTISGGDAEQIIATESAVVVNISRELKAFDATTGKEQWQYEPEDSSRLGLVTQENALFVSHNDSGRVVRLPLPN